MIAEYHLAEVLAAHISVLEERIVKLKYRQIVNVEQVIASAVAGGADAIILREKDMHREELIKLAVKVKDSIKGKVPIIINGDYEAALNAVK